MARADDERQWRDPRNWIGPRWLGLYRAPGDSRLWVPKVPRWAGWTINLGHPAGRATVAVLLALAVGALLVGAWTTR